MIYRIVKTETPEGPRFEIRKYPWHPQGKLLGDGLMIVRYTSEAACRQYLQDRGITLEKEESA